METVYTVHGSNRYSGDESVVHLGYYIGTEENIKLWIKNHKLDSIRKYSPSNGGELEIHEFDIYKIARRV